MLFCNFNHAVGTAGHKHLCVDLTFRSNLIIIKIVLNLKLLINKTYIQGENMNNMSNTKSRQKELDCLENSKKFISTNGSVYKYLKLAMPNYNVNKFPDFVFNCGFIEHFQVTSANENRNGDKHRIAELQFERESEKILNEVQLEYEKLEPCSGRIITDVLEMNCPEYSYENFVESFKHNFENHIRSLENYHGDKSVGIFLIEYSGARIKVMKGDRFLELYKIKYDKNMLLYLQDFADRLKYIICFWGDTQGNKSGDASCEVVELSKIQEMVLKVPQNIVFEMGRIKSAKILSFLDL